MNQRAKALPPFDTETVTARLTSLPERARVWFATAAACRLLPAYQLFCRESGHGMPDELGRALELTWNPNPPVDQLAEAARAAERSVPDEDSDNWDELSAYAQNAAAAVAYALQTAESGDPRLAMWAGWQLYEAADYAARQAEPEADPNAPETEARLHASEVVQSALREIETDLRLLEAAGDQSRTGEQLRHRAEAHAPLLVTVITNTRRSG